MKMEEYIPRREHEEFAKRIEENIHDLKQEVSGLSGIVRSVDKLASNMEHMLEEQKNQGERLTAIENRDGDTWRAVIRYTITAAIGILVGYIFKHLGF